MLWPSVCGMLHAWPPADLGETRAERGRVRALWGYLHGLLAHVVEQGPDEAASTGDQDEERELRKPLRAEQVCDPFKGQHALAPPADPGGMRSGSVKLPVTLFDVHGLPVAYQR